MKKTPENCMESRYENWDAFIKAEYQKIRLKEKLQEKIRRKTNWEWFKRKYGWQVWIKSTAALYCLAMPKVFQLIEGDLELESIYSVGMLIALGAMCIDLRKLGKFGGGKNDGSQCNIKTSARSKSSKRASGTKHGCNRKVEK